METPPFVDDVQMEVSIVMGIPNSWLVFIVENPNLEMDDD